MKKSKHLDLEKKETISSTQKNTKTSMRRMSIKPPTIKKKGDLSTFINDRKILPEIPEKCIEIINNNIFIKNTKIKFVNIIGHGGSSIIIKGQDQQNGKEYTIKAINHGQAIFHIKLEVSLMNNASKLIDNNTNQHFVKYYKDFKCNKVEDNEIGIDSSFYSHIFKEYFYIIIMELYHGDTIKLLYNDSIPEKVKKNVNTQIFISLLSFHILLKAIHNDAKHANFFYKKISSNDNDYIHYLIYGINIYVKNMGYIIVIGDYGQCETTYSNKDILKDYDIIEELGIRNNFYNISQNPKTTKDFTTEKEYILYLIQNTDLFNQILPPNGKIINTDKPYILDE